MTIIFILAWITDPADFRWGHVMMIAVSFFITLAMLYLNEESRKMVTFSTLLFFPMVLSLQLGFHIGDLADPGIHLYAIWAAASVITIAMFISFYRIGMFDKNATDASVFGKRAARY